MAKKEKAAKAEKKAEKARPAKAKAQAKEKEDIWAEEKIEKKPAQKNIEAAGAKKEAKASSTEGSAFAGLKKAEAKFASVQELAKSGVNTEIVFYPLITEKAVGMIEAQNKLCFIVSDNASKPSIKKAIEAMYGVKIEKINIVRDMKGRKKAIVKLDKRFKADEVAMKLGVI